MTWGGTRKGRASADQILFCCAAAMRHRLVPMPAACLPTILPRVFSRRSLVKLVVCGDGRGGGRQAGVTGLCAVERADADVFSSSGAAAGRYMPSRWAGLDGRRWAGVARARVCACCSLPSLTLHHLSYLRAARAAPALSAGACCGAAAITAHISSFRERNGVAPAHPPSRAAAYGRRLSLCPAHRLHLCATANVVKSRLYAGA